MVSKLRTRAILLKSFREERLFQATISLICSVASLVVVAENGVNVPDCATNETNCTKATTRSLSVKLT